MSPGAVAAAPLLSLLLFSAQNCTILQCTPAIIFIGGRALFSVSAFTIMFCVRAKVALLQCDIALCKRCTLTPGLCNAKKKKLSLPGGAKVGSKGARPCRGSQPQITALRTTSTSKAPFIAIHFEAAFSSIFVSCNSLKRNEFNLLLRCTPSSSKQGW